PVALRGNDQFAVERDPATVQRDQPRFDMLRQTRARCDRPAEHRFRRHLVHVLAPRPARADKAPGELAIRDRDRLGDLHDRPLPCPASPDLSAPSWPALTVWRVRAYHPGPPIPEKPMPVPRRLPSWLPLLALIGL